MVRNEVINMEFSPLAREKLAQIGELTQEEKTRLKHSQHLASVLADYFTAKLSPEDLWKKLKTQKEEGRGFLLREAQLKLMDAINLSASERDFDRQRRGILAVETLKNEGNYTALEQSLDSIQNLRRQYREGSEKTFRVIKGKIEKQVRLAAQAGARGASIDIQGSVEATAKASPGGKTSYQSTKVVLARNLKTNSSDCGK
ncbi:MAG: hypothetical protein ACE5LA_06530 [Dehalococcoidales bacterium]